ncbi:DNA repair protein RecN [Sinimarinibacterium sp. CAU 1509]|uniref:DNA repair protein RecN n=1 Tax=Sinimarinibacterium sp. CAU 1509 TaxID=2562283 RepID=UPI0010ABDF52|nr:DNA repair protein RecN [Sinimarinibacterium sp. CAU 1509]TJY55793.1 DNA repair protein RecN [Sinimarinibacterium sp. CAU 1509]
MLKNLTITNLAVIDSLSLEWDAGFSVLTGETGAGKSILVDAIGLIIGTRADAQLVRAGQERAEVSAAFELEPASAATGWLEEQALLDPEQPDELLIRRIVQANGRTRAFVNGSAVTTAQLRELGELLIEIFGQSESQTLLRSEIQRELLDVSGNHAQLLAAVADAHAQVAAIDNQIEQLRQQAGRDPSQLDYLRYQVSELRALKLADDELDQLNQEHKSLANAGQLLRDGGRVQELLYSGDDSVYDRLSECLSTLQQLAPLHQGFDELANVIATAQAQVQDAADGARQLLDHLDLDPERLYQIEQRLGAIHDLARKHRVRPDALLAHISALGQELDSIENGAEQLQALQQQRDAAERHYRSAAAALSATRHKSAQRHAKEVTAIVRQLGMPNAQFQIAVDSNPQGPLRVHGSDDIRFDFSANPGQPLRPLAKVASGGELSRVSLALSVAGQHRGGTPTMIFDEVDAGIGGAVAEIVGQKLRALGSDRQVLSVTHLAQVAAQGHQHYQIRKQVRGGNTFTQVVRLDDEQRIEELARMQGGVEISSAALAHARDLLERAANAS